MSADIIADARTTLTAGAVGSLAGFAAYRGGNFILKTAGINPGASLGDDLIAFCVHGITSSITYAAGVNFAPEASSNLYFSYVFFQTSDGTTNAILRLMGRLLDTVEGGLPSSGSSAAQSRSGLDRQASQQSSCASC
jgi:hypothetical protein